MILVITCVCSHRLEKYGDSDEDVRLLTPYFDQERDAQSWKKQLEASRAKPAKAVPKVTDIRDASTFLRMRLSEKRACLRASGIYALPRPREGPRKIDAVMIPLLDEEVAYEVLRRLGETRGDLKLAAKMQDYETRKPVIAKMYSEAKRKGDDQRARELCDELNAIATLRFDPRYTSYYLHEHMSYRLPSPYISYCICICVQ